MNPGLDSFLGTFWLIPHPLSHVAILAHKIPASEAEEYGDCLTCPTSHCNAWEATKLGRIMLEPVDAPSRVTVARHEYEEWSRVRAVFDRSRPGFVIYADRQAFPHAATIRQCFVLPYNSILRTDPHYCNTRRIPV
jgi:hypothetical protein